MVSFLNSLKLEDKNIKLHKQTPIDKEVNKIIYVSDSVMNQMHRIGGSFKTGFSTLYKTNTVICSLCATFVTTNASNRSRASSAVAKETTRQQ